MNMKKLIFSLFLSLTTVFSFTTGAFGQDISGTYTGTLKAEGGEGPGGSGSIVLKQEGQTLTVTAGPNLDKQSPATKVVRDGELLKFELVPPGAEGHGLMSFEVTVKDGKLTGKVTMTRDGDSQIGRLDLVKR